MAEWLAGHGARFDDGEVVDFGDAVAEYLALREGSALVPRAGRALLEVCGADRRRFLNGYLTCEVKGLPEGGAAYGFLTAREGKVLADALLADLPEALQLALPAARAAAIRSHLARYLLADRVELVERPELAVWEIAGPRAGEALAAVGLPVPEAGRSAWLPEEEIALVRHDLGRLPAWELRARPEALAALAERLLAAGPTRLAGAAAREIARVEEGVPACGRDFGEEHFPQETGLEAAAVSYTKGCYLGQEVVARIHYRGGVQRGLRGLRFPGGLPAPGAELLHDGREAGRVTSAVLSPRHGAIGLAILHRRVDEGGALALAGGGEALLAPLPFAD
ncbi:MAG: hypothetical protein M5U13_00660 [Thermoanaerobaculia bacterium]|nr:hypothetical protein [Thermoanaerobaculia bacterium]